MIHSLNRKVIRKALRKQHKRNIETRDAILWDIIPAQKICRVKFQGSDTLIEAKYPESYDKLPRWLKPGNAVRVVHTGGRQFRVEVVGPGLFVPSPVTGSQASPTPGTGQNTVLSGARVHALDTPSMNVYVETGTYRISGIVYTLGAMTMSESNNTTMASGVPIDITAGVVSIAAASATQWRIDIIVVASDGVLDVVTGTPADSNPETPTVPAGHVLLGTVKIPPGQTAIYEYLCNVPYSETMASQIVADSQYTELNWSTSYDTITVTVKDQYNNPVLGEYLNVTAEIINGSGNLGGGDLTEITTGINITTGQAVFIYYRDSDYQDPGASEEGPVFITFTVVQSNGISTVTSFNLLDESGDYIYV